MFKSTPDKPVLNELTPQEVKARLDAHDCVLIDVREPGEFEAERISEALLHPLSKFDAGAVPFGGARTVILHCGAGKRSEQAAALAHAAGITEVTHMKGGLSAWKSAGLPVISYNPATGESE